ncbi:MAG: hypothetical protein LBJ02_07425 [Bifidobacteriaceae bacterium]|nr:hypothetical protein [Bifidobacteriaceae bacterium]
MEDWPTLEPQLLAANGLEATNRILSRTDTTEEQLLKYMAGHKTAAGPGETGAALKPEARAKLSVAVTRARHSVGIMTNSRTTKSNLPFWTPAHRFQD